MKFNFNFQQKQQKVLTLRSKLNQDCFDALTLNVESINSNKNNNHES